MSRLAILARSMVEVLIPGVVLVMALAVALALGGMGRTEAQAAATITISTSSGPVGWVVTVNGFGFTGAPTPETGITVKYDSTNIASGVTATASGTIGPFSFTIPSSLSTSHIFSATRSAGSVTPAHFTLLKPAISLSTSSGPPGSKLTVTGSNFAVNETGITVTFGSTTVASGINAASSGNWIASFAVPALALGSYPVSASGPISLAGTVPAQTFTIVKAAFPGGNGKVAFTSGRDGNAEIYVMNLDGSGVTRLTTDPAIDFAPAWSPDGRKIAFACGFTNDVRSGEICLMNAEGSGLTRLTNNLVPDSEPTWSPDGRKIAFQRPEAPGGNWDIYTMNLDGSGVSRLTTNAAASVAAWSPDGTQIAFASVRDGNHEIYVMRADGTGATNVTNDPLNVDDQPAWSPDGTRIAFQKNPVEGGPVAIYVMAADGSGQVRITPVPGNNSQPAWSPDGTKIAFTRFTETGLTEIFVMNSDGTGATNLTNNPSFDEGPDWQPLSLVGVDLSLTKTDSPDPVAPGALLTYSLKVTNPGSGSATATGVFVTETLPAGVTFASATPSQGSYNSGTGVWTVGTLAAIGSATIQLKVSVGAAVPSGTVLTNTAVVAADQPDPSPANNTAVAQTKVELPVDVEPPTCRTVDAFQDGKDRLVVRFLFEDAGSGLARVDLMRAVNADVLDVRFPEGPADPMVMTLRQGDPAAGPMNVRFRLTDRQGNRVATACRAFPNAEEPKDETPAED
jgi:uncharacterized repeat protein (TIGR01451 family)